MRPSTTDRHAHQDRPVAADGITVEYAGLPNYVSYTASGFTRAIGGGTLSGNIVVCDDRGDRAARVISLAATGRPQSRAHADVRARRPATDTRIATRRRRPRESPHAPERTRLLARRADDRRLGPRHRDDDRRSELPPARHPRPSRRRDRGAAAHGVRAGEVLHPEQQLRRLRRARLADDRARLVHAGRPGG